jgi:hypothetical protein
VSDLREGELALSGCLASLLSGIGTHWRLNLTSRTSKKHTNKILKFVKRHLEAYKSLVLLEIQDIDIQGIVKARIKALRQLMVDYKNQNPSEINVSDSNGYSQ